MPIDPTELNIDNSNVDDRMYEITESITMIDDQKIGYCRYGHGKHYLLFICGGVGKNQN